MTEKFEETIQKATQVLYDGRLKEAIDLLRPIYDGHPSLVGYDDLDRIGKDYAMMRDYMLLGYADRSGINSTTACSATSIASWPT